MLTIYISTFNWLFKFETIFINYGPHFQPENSQPYWPLYVTAVVFSLRHHVRPKTFSAGSFYLNDDHQLVLPSASPDSAAHEGSADQFLCELSHSIFFYIASPKVVSLSFSFWPALSSLTTAMLSLEKFSVVCICSVSSFARSFWTVV